MEVIHSLSQGGDRSRNLMRRNGGLEVWQRPYNLAVGAGIQSYTADGWIMAAAAAEASTVTRVAGLTNQSQWAAKVQRNAGQTGVVASYFDFPLDTDEIFPLLGQYLRLSFVAKAGANWSAVSGNLACQLLAGTGPPAPSWLMSPAPTVPINVAATLTVTPTRYEFASSVIIPVTTRAVTLHFIWTPVGTAGADDSFTIDDVQLEVVASPSQPASPFERMHFADELLLCQRHYFKTFDYDIVPDAGAGGAGAYIAQVGVSAANAGAGRPMCNLRFPVPMRRAPTIQLYNPVTLWPTAGWDQVRNTNGGLNHTGSVSAASTMAVRVVSTGHASGVAGQLMYVQLTADASI